MPDWPHAPVHRLDEEGTYIVTAGTYRKRHLFHSPERLELLHDTLLDVAAEFRWSLQAWAVLANHYHFVAISLHDPRSLRTLLSKLHMLTAKRLNQWDAAPGRKVWFQFWDTQITYQRSYLARLNYVHHNPVKHGVAQEAAQYPWCSAAWLERAATAAFRKTVRSFKTDRVKVVDDS